MFKEPLDYLKHIADECAYIISTTNSLSEDRFLNDETLKRAITRSIEIIGEASKKIPKEYKEKQAFVAWKDMAGVRDRLIHDYIGINYLIVWDVIKNKIPQLNILIQKLIDEGE